MGKVKQMCLENEEKFYDIVSNIVSECDSVQECLSKVDLDLVRHLPEKDVEEIVNDIWTDYWQKFSEMNER